MLTQDDIKNALKAVKYPGYSRDIVSFGLVKEISTTNDAVSVTMQLTASNSGAARQIKEDSERVLKALPGVELVHVEVRQPAGGQAAPGALPNQNRIPGVRRVIAVASGKGGVGKSTCSANLACALARLGARVGLLDCDIYGPSIPLMMGTHERPGVTEDETMMIPPTAHGVKLMSIGFLIADDQPVIWRGPMIAKTIQQFLFAVEWGGTDFLLVDLPPGTGDAQLSLCQTVPLDGGVIVTTPQEASLGVVRKGIAMFEKVSVPILGIVENMRRPGRGRAAEHSVSGRSADFHGNPRRRRLRRAGGGFRAGQTGGAGVHSNRRSVAEKAGGMISFEQTVHRREFPNLSAAIQFLTNEKGRKTAVLPIEDREKL